ncbi:MAG: hypothetical protein HQL31_08320 [Planctomycetes bacterium]|nr:hypothetical protein [Planctomycetota bacterium]
MIAEERILLKAPFFSCTGEVFLIAFFFSTEGAGFSLEDFGLLREDVAEGDFLSDFFICSRSVKGNGVHLPVLKLISR